MTVTAERLAEEETRPWRFPRNLTLSGGDGSEWAMRMGGKTWLSVANGVVAKRWTRPPGAVTFCVFLPSLVPDSNCGVNVLVPVADFDALRLAAEVLASANDLCAPGSGGEPPLRVLFEEACDLLDAAEARGWAVEALLFDVVAGERALLTLAVERPLDRARFAAHR